MQRTPPLAVRKILRAEVGFSCPECGSPFLEYHHFDPEFHVENHHRPEGMIALCVSCHSQAKAFAVEKLREMKSKRAQNVEGKFKWKRKHTVFVCGGSYYYGCQAMLCVSGQSIVAFEKDEEDLETLSLHISGSDSKSVFLMSNNDWLSRADVDDLDVQRSGRKMTLRSQGDGIRLSLEFRDLGMLKDFEKAILEDFGISSDEHALFCYLTGSIRFPEKIEFQNEGIRFGSLHIQGDKHANCGVGLNL